MPACSSQVPDARRRPVLGLPAADRLPSRRDAKCCYHQQSQQEAPVGPIAPQTGSHRRGPHHFARSVSLIKSLMTRSANARSRSSAGDNGLNRILTRFMAVFSAACSRVVRIIRAIFSRCVNGRGGFIGVSLIAGGCALVPFVHAVLSFSYRALSTRQSSDDGWTNVAGLGPCILRTVVLAGRIKRRGIKWWQTRPSARR